MIKELFKISKATHGKGPVLFRWDPTGKYLATVGASRRVYLWERNGDQFDEFPVLASTAPKGQPPSQILQIEWNKDGEILAVLQDGSSVIQLYHLNEKKTRELETNFKDPSFMCWARAGPQLAIGTAKGNLILYNTTTMKSQVIQGKHTKKITCGSWNLENKLALASQDRMMTVSDDKGELLEQAKLKYDPFDIQFAEQKMDELKNDVKENTISINMGHQTILMYNMADTENPVELAFQAKYGEIASYRWFGDGYMMVGFSKGYVIAISTHMKEIGEELQSLKVHEGVLYDVCYAPVLNRLASCGDDGVRIVDMSDWKEVKTEHREFSKEEGDPERMDWTKDGQILTVATNGGYVFNFLMSIPALSAYNGSKLVYLSSLRHVSVIDVANESTPAINVEIAVEPSFIALGPNHVAVGMNNHSWFYPISGKSESNAAIEREYVGTVKQICLNDLYAAVLCDGKVHLHLIMPDSSDKRDYISFPEKDDAQVTSISLTNDFLIYCTSRGTVHHWYIKDWAQVNEYRHDVSVNRVFSNSIGTRIVFIDANNKGILYSPVDDSRVEIPSFPPSVESILWDLTDPSTLIAVDPKLHRNLITYNYTSQSIKGPVVVKVSNTKFPHGFAPIMFYDGMVHGQKPNGSLSLIALSSHDAITNVKGRRNTDKLRQALQQLLALNRLKQAWDLALMMKNKEQMVTLARKAMEQLDIELAIRVYRELKDSAMVLALHEIIHVEDKHLLAGHICLLNGDYSKAQSLFLTSSYPIAALQMRRDLLHWDHALKLAASLSPEQMPYICREYAQQLEVKGEHKMALDMYQKGLSEAKDALTDDHRQICNGGIARMTLRMGDLPKGRKLALESGKKELMKECAAILESMKQYNEAAEMYVFAENFEKAASIYCSLKNFTKAAPLMDKITTPKIHLQYAKAKESEKDYAAAAAAYEKAKDLDSVVRINLQYLDNPQKAYNIVRATKSATGAATVSNYCKENNDIAGAVEFLLMAKRSDEAFLLAKQNKSMDVYAKALGDDGSQDEYTNIALHYEEEKDYSRAGHFYAICGDYQKAIKLFLQSEDPKNIDAAINVVKRAQGQPGAELLVRQLHDFLIGETDGKVKDLNFIFRLYMAIGEYQQAANTAILIANQEQQVGQYTTAHGILFAMHQDLIAQKLPIPTDLKRNLLLLHSYVLAKKMTAKSEHEGAARMLIRVAKNITKFPAHVVPILTSTVIECQRAKLQRTCYEYAAMLMRPEYRNSVDQKYRKPIETFVRRPVHEEANEKLTACPYCQFELPETLLECPSCKNSIPYCIASGRHMIYNDWTNCPSCKFPALYSVFVERIKADKICYMCNKQVSLADVKRIDDPKPFLLKNETDEKKTTKAPAATGAGSAAGEINPLDITPNFK